MKIKAIYPGPSILTSGHEDLVKRASNIFESVIVAVASNTQKILCSHMMRDMTCAKKSYLHTKRESLNLID